MCSEREPRLSIITACYNASTTVAACLRSLEPLAEENVEIILIDDGSTDGTVAAIRSELSRSATLSDAVTLLLNDSNLGSAASRRRGMLAARGRYIVVVDADDYVDSAPLAAALKQATAADADCIAAPITEHRDGKVTTIHPDDLTDLNRVRIHVTNFSLCNKLIRRRLLIDNALLPQDGLDRWEDVSVTARLLARRPRIITTDRSWYHYLISSSRPSLSSFSRHKTLRERIAVTRLVESDLTVIGVADEFEPFISTLKFYAKAGYLRGPHKDFRTWAATFPEINRRIMSLKTIPLHYRIGFTAVSLLFSKPSSLI